jgi:hypothetical protein
MPNTSSAFALGAEENLYCTAPLKKCILPPGARPLCFARSDTNQTSDQFCGYIQNGMVYSAKGCCTPACPSFDCPRVPPTNPTGVVPPGVEKSPELIREQERYPTAAVAQSQLPVSKFVQLILLTLSILVVSALLLAL